MRAIARYFIFIVLFSLVVTPAYGEGEGEVYYCADNDGQGFEFQEKLNSYKPGRYVEKKFKIKFDKANKSIEFAIDGGSEFYTCTVPYIHNIHKFNLFQCAGAFNTINFNADNGRYVRTRGYGYMAGDHDSVIVYIGQCDKF